jgi:hypothetical protein
MALTRDELKDLAKTLVMMVTVLDKGTSPAELRERLRDAGVPDSAVESWMETAVALSVAPKQVADPGYRKGTAMQPAKWKDCLWRPTP